MQLNQIFILNIVAIDVEDNALNACKVSLFHPFHLKLIIN